MTRSLGVALVLALSWAAHPSSAPQTTDRPAGVELVSTWTLTTLERGAGGGAAARVANPRGLLILDRAGHVFEFVTSLATQRADRYRSPRHRPLSPDTAGSGVSIVSTPRSAR